MRKRGRESRTAVCSSTGMFTRPNAIEPFQSARAIGRPGARRTPSSQPANGSDEGGVGGWKLTLAERAFSLEPVVEIAAVFTAALQIAAVGSLGDYLGARRTSRGAVDIAGDPHIGCAVGSLSGSVGGRRPVA